MNINKRLPNDDTIYLLNLLLNSMQDIKINKILDLGSDTGYYHEYILPDKTDLQFIGIDNNIIDLQIKQNRSIVYKYDVTKLPFKFIDNDLKFDLVIMMELLQYIEDPIKLIKDIKKYHAHKDTLYFITVPNKKSLDDIVNNIDLSVYDPDLENLTFGRWNKYYKRYYDFNSLIKVIQKADLDIVFISGCNGFATPLMQNIITNISNTFNIDPIMVNNVICRTLYSLSPNIAILAKNKEE